MDRRDARGGPVDSAPGRHAGPPVAGGYIPAVHFHALTPLYDTFVRWLMLEARIKRQLVAQAGLEAGHRVLDLGCGTGTLTILMAERQPRARVVGLDPDRAILGIARRKAAARGAGVAWVEGMAHGLPFADDALDRVVSCLVFHHLAPAIKRRAAREAYRVLRPGGELHVLDFGRPREPVAVALSLVMRWLEEVDENIAGRIPDILTDAGFEGVAELDHTVTVFGSVSFYRAHKPRSRQETSPPGSGAFQAAADDAGRHDAGVPGRGLVV